MPTTRPTSAMIALMAQVKFSDYPIEDSLVRKTFKNADLRGKRLEVARELQKDLLMQQNRAHERFVHEFVSEMAQRYPNSGFERFGFTFFNTNSPEAIVLCDDVDDSYAIGLDYGM